MTEINGMESVPLTIHQKNQSTFFKQVKNRVLGVQNLRLSVTSDRVREWYDSLHGQLLEDSEVDVWLDTSAISPPKILFGDYDDCRVRISTVSFMLAYLGKFEGANKYKEIYDELLRVDTISLQSLEELLNGENVHVSGGVVYEIHKGTLSVNKRISHEVTEQESLKEIEARINISEYRRELMKKYFELVSSKKKSDKFPKLKGVRKEKDSVVEYLTKEMPYSRRDWSRPSKIDCAIIGYAFACNMATGRRQSILTRDSGIIANTVQLAKQYDFDAHSEHSGLDEGIPLKAVVF